MQAFICVNLRKKRKTWYHYITNVLDPNLFSAKQVCEIYRHRWNIEDAFNITKRLLGLSYLWVGDSNGVQIQIFATWIFYIVLNDLCTQVAIKLNEPKELISVELVFRSLGQFYVDKIEKKVDSLVNYLVENHKILGLVKSRRKRHRETEAISHNIWVLTS